MPSTLMTPEADLQLAKDELRLSTEFIEHATGLFSTKKPASLVLYASGCEIGEAVEVRTVSDPSQGVQRAKAVAQLAKQYWYDKQDVSAE